MGFIFFSLSGSSAHQPQDHLYTSSFSIAIFLIQVTTIPQVDDPASHPATPIHSSNCIPSDLPNMQIWLYHSSDLKK